MTASTVPAFMEAFRGGGIGMWIILGHLALMLLLAWGWALAQIISVAMWRRRMADLAETAEARDPHGLMDRLKGKKGKAPTGALGETLSAAAIGVREDRPPREILSRANETLHHSIAAVHPARGVVTAVVLLMSIFAPLMLGSLFREMGMIQAFGALEMAAPEQRCAMLGTAMKFAAYPARFGLITMGLLLLPSLLATFLQLTLLGAKRRRDDILRLVDMLVGVDVRPRAGIAVGIISFVFALIVTVVGAWFLSGAPTRNLMAPFLMGNCLGITEGDGLQVPVAGGEPAEKLDGLVVQVTDSGLLVGDTLVLELTDGEIAPMDRKGGYITALSENLKEQEQMSAMICERTARDTDCTPDRLLVLNASIPLETASRIIGTCFHEYQGNVYLVVRTQAIDEDPRSLDEMEDEVKGLTGMKCAVQCPYRTVKVGDVIFGGKSSGSSKSLLDGSGPGAYGDFITDLDSDTVMVTVPSP